MPCSKERDQVYKEELVDKKAKDCKKTKDKTIV